MTDLARWQARVIPAPEVPRPYVNADWSAVAPAFSSTPVFMLPSQWTLAWAGRLVRFRQAHPVIAGQAASWAGEGRVWHVDRILTNPISSTPTVTRLQLGPTQVTNINPMLPAYPDDMVDAVSVDHATQLVRRWNAPHDPLPGPDSAAWTQLGEQTVPDLASPPALVAPIIIGNVWRESNAWPAMWNGRIYWVEMRAGLTPGEGPVLWRWDAAEYDRAAATVTPFVDPRGRTWVNQWITFPAQPMRFEHGLPAPRRATVSRPDGHIFTGTGPPGMLPGQAEGDRYIDTNTGDIYWLVWRYGVEKGTGINITTPHRPTFNVTDIDCRVHFRPGAWPIGSGYWASRWITAGDQRSWRLLGRVGGQLGGEVSADGITVAPSPTNSPVTTMPPEGRHFRCQHDSDDGAGGRTTAWLESADGVDWLPLGAPTTTAGTGVPFAANAQIEVGNGVWGRYWSFVLLDGINGHPVASPDFTQMRLGDTSLTDAQGNVWTLGSGATVERELLWERVPT